MLKILQEHKTSSGISFQEHIRDLVKKLSEEKTKLRGKNCWGKKKKKRLRSF